MVGPGTFFVTKNLESRCPILCHKHGDILPANIVVETLFPAAREERIHLAAFCVMPDHWHALFGLIRDEGEGVPPPTEPDDRLSLSKGMRLINSSIGRHTGSILNTRAAVWQDGYHETRIRSTKQFEHILRYIEHNPVNGGFCQNNT